MQRQMPVLVVWGFVCGCALLTAGAVSGQDRSAARERGRRPVSKAGEVITPPDRSQRWANQLQVGGVAPEFTLPLLVSGGANGTPGGNPRSARKPREDALQTVTLGDLRARQPVVLIFGSITCPPFRGQLEAVDRVYETFKDRAQFLFVYIREAHPDSVLSVVDQNGREGLLEIPQATDLSMRTASAGACQRTAKLNMPIAVDQIDNSVGKAYAGWPNRMVVVGTSGRVLFASEPSPRGTDAQRLQAWLDENLTDSSH